MKNFLVRFFSLPLLAKDLTERAAHPRTFILRLVFGLLFLCAFSMYYMGRASQGRYYNSGALETLLGTGADTFFTLGLVLTCAIILFQPALMAGVLTHEKERETFSLLLLADMGPWRLLIQKFLGGLLPMFTLLMYGLPLGAIAYAYGGVTTDKMFGTALVLAGAWLQFGSVALFCSAWFRTTTSATVAAYVVAAVLIFGSDYALWVKQDSAKTMRPRTVYSASAEYVRMSPTEILRQVTEWTTYRAPDSRYRCFIATAPMFASAALFLLLSRLVLVRRALLPVGNGARRLFLRLDWLFELLNKAFGGAAILRSKSHDLPVEQPILWRETSRGILGRPQHLLRLGLFLLIVLSSTVVLLLVINPFRRIPENLTFLMESVVLFGVLAVAALSCDAIGRERTQQTMEVMLTTPMTPRQIITEKLSSPRRLGWIFIANALLIAFLLVALQFQFPDAQWLAVNSEDAKPVKAAYPWIFVSCGAVGLPLTFLIVRWFSVWIGIRIRNRSRALMTCLGILTLWVGAPTVIRVFSPESTRVIRWAQALGPIGIVTHAENGTFAKLYRPADDDWRRLSMNNSKRTPSLVAGILTAVGLQTLFFLVFRFIALRAADKHLRC